LVVPDKGPLNGCSSSLEKLHLGLIWDNVDVSPDKAVDLNVIN